MVSAGSWQDWGHFLEAMAPCSDELAQPRHVREAPVVKVEALGPRLEAKVVLPGR